MEVQKSTKHTYPKPRLKVCCIASVEEAQLAIDYGAVAIGLVSSMPSGPGVIPEELIGEIAVAVPPGIGTFLLTSSEDVDEIIAQQERCRVNTLQLCNPLPVNDIEYLKQALPDVSMVPVIHVVDEDAIEQAKAMSQVAHALLLDSGNPNKRIKELGGTGRTHDWSISRSIRESVSIPVFLAGGLHADNVGAAIRQVQPYGVDVCSGLRTDDVLDEAKLTAFIRSMDAARMSLGS
ncbi:phosphoribosylanthranilate isomerase [Candidatus Neomarinimicrobiota bacterium]